MAKSNRFTKKFKESVHDQIFAVLEENNCILEVAKKDKKLRKKVEPLIAEVLRFNYFNVQAAMKREQEFWHEFGTVEYYKKQMKLITVFEGYCSLSFGDWIDKYFCKMEKYE